MCSLLGLTVTLVIKMWISCSAKRRPKIKNKTTKLITKKKGNKRKKKKKGMKKNLKKDNGNHKEAGLTDTHSRPVAPD